MTVRLVQPGSGKAITVADDRADQWRGLGYRDEADPPEQGEAESPPPPPSRPPRTRHKKAAAKRAKQVKEGSDPDG